MRHAISLAGLFGLLGHLGLGSLAGQQIKPALQSWEPVSSAYEREFRADTQHTFPLPRRDYRYEGLAFGGIVFAVAGGWVGWNVAEACPALPGARCEPDRLGNAVALGLAGAAVGGGLGYLIGRLSSKPDPNQMPATGPGRASPDSMALIPDSTRRLVGYQHWKGAAIGAGSGALVGALLGLRAGTGCSDCNIDVAKASLVTAGLGGAFGFLIGLASPKYEPR